LGSLGLALVLFVAAGLLAGPVRADPPEPPARIVEPATNDAAPGEPGGDAPEEGTGDAPTSSEDPVGGDGAADALTSAGDQVEELRTHVQTLRDELEALREQVGGLAAQLASTRPALHTYRLPAEITFAGEPVPLDRWDVAERLEREFYLALGDPAQAVLWLKRSARYFPYIEDELQAAQLPDDLKYVAVIESALRPRAYSYARASGIWQFIPDTARRYGLRVTRALDERRDPARSTAAAIAYLRDLYRRFRSWPLALAGYNFGEKAVAEALKRQGVSTYYQLALPLETERYFFRTLAAKLLLEDPGRYGLPVPPEERYSPHTTDLVDLQVVGYLRVRELATAAGSFYREIKTLNPAVMGDVLPAGRYQVRIPRGRSAPFAGALPALARAMAARDVRRMRYRVKGGDTLAGIARRFGVSVGALKKWNAAARKPHIYPGDVLSIEVSGRSAPE
jgi:membrane-bound lytic murein transglycosylase D